MAWDSFGILLGLLKILLGCVSLLKDAWDELGFLLGFF